MARLLALLLTVSLVACDDDDEPAPATEPEAPPAPEPEPEPAGPALELHEWGLVSERIGMGRGALSHSHGRVNLADLLGEGLGDVGSIGESFGTSGLGLSGIGRGGGKPVIYAHLAEGVEEHTFSLGVEVRGGNVVEHWPLTAEAGPRPSVRWANVRAHRGDCGETAYPAADDPACQTEDDFCEAKHGDENETDDGACLEIDGRSFDHLFYRAAMSNAPLPLEVEVVDGAVTVRHLGSAPIPGRLVRVRGDDAAPADGSGGLPLVVLDPPAPGQTVTVPAPTESATLDAPLRAGLAELGMSQDEASAFVRAWEVHLVRGEAQRPAMPATLEEPTDALLYWMPEAEVATHVALTPSERVTMRRALLVRVGLAYD